MGVPFLRLLLYLLPVLQLHILHEIHRGASPPILFAVRLLLILLPVLQLHILREIFSSTVLLNVLTLWLLLILLPERLLGFLILTWPAALCFLRLSV